VQTTKQAPPLQAQLQERYTVYGRVRFLTVYFHKCNCVVGHMSVCAFLGVCLCGCVGYACALSACECDMCVCVFVCMCCP